MNKEDVKALRKKLGLTQAQLAEKMGVTLQAVQHWEQGRRAVTGSAKMLMQCLGKKARK
jgi:putative transcriptional regulator